LQQEAAVPGLILATVTPDNTPGGAVLTFAFPLGLFVVIAAVLYLWLGRPHRRVPADLTPVATSAAIGAPHPEAARGASVAAGLPTAVGGGGAESPIEPAGAVRKTEDNGVSAPVTGAGGPAAGTSETTTGTTASPGTADPAEDSGAGPSAADTGTGNVSGQETGQEAADPERGTTERGTTDGTEASE
jgi:hypothetical protein